MFIKQKLCKVLQAIGEEEQNLEILRQITFENSQFDAFQAFQQIDIQHKNYIDAYDIFKFLQDNNIFHSLIELMIKMENQIMLGKIFIYMEIIQFFIRFLQSILSKDFGKYLVQKNAIQKQFQTKINKESEIALAQLISKEIQSFENLESEKFKLIECVDFFSLRDLFSQITKNCKQEININDIQQFFKLQGEQIYDEQVQSIFKRIDRFNTGSISYNDFLASLLPQQIFIKNLQLNNKQQNHQSQNKNQLNQLIRNSQNIKKEQKITCHLFSKKGQNFVPAKMQLKKKNNLKRTNEQTRNKVGIKIQNKISQNSEMKNNKKLMIQLYAEQRELVNVWNQFIKLDMQCELIKEQLSLQSDWNLIDGFKLIDLKDKGFIIAGELEQFLAQLQLFPDRHDIYLLIRRFSDQKTGKLTFENFCNFLLPKRNELANLLKARVNRRNLQPLDQIFSQQTKILIQSVYETQIISECICEALRQRLNQRSQYDYFLLFKIMDSTDQGFIGEAEIKQVFEKNKIVLSSKQLNILMLRFNIKGTLKINFSDFFKEMNVTSPKNYLE